jgi:hypothetical protein
MRLSIIIFFIYNLVIFYHLIPIYNSPCNDALIKYKWTQDPIDDQVAYFVDPSINSICYINYNKQLDIFYVFDDTNIVRMNQFFIRILISFSVTLFFGIMKIV